MLETRLQYLQRIEKFIEEICRTDGASSNIIIEPLDSTATRIKLNTHIELSGYHLVVRREIFRFVGRGFVEKEFRYTIFAPGDPINDENIEPLIRLQTDRFGEATNAHFEPNLPAHFPVVLWPRWLRDTDVEKAYALLQHIESNGGKLPSEFDHSRMETLA